MISVEAWKDETCEACTTDPGPSALRMDAGPLDSDDPGFGGRLCSTCAHKLWIALGLVLGGHFGITPTQLLKRKTP